MARISKKVRESVKSGSSKEERDRRADAKMAYGDEPKGVPITTNLQLIIAFNTLTAYYDSANLHSFVAEFAKRNNDEELVKLLPNVPHWAIPSALGNFAKLISNGCQLAPDMEERFKTSLEKFKVEAGRKYAEVEKPTKVIRLRESKSSLVIADLESIIDERDFEFDVLGTFQKMELMPSETRRIAEYYQPYLDELVELETEKTPDLVEAYRNHTKKQIREQREFLEKIVAACQFRLAERKAQRKPRKARKKAVEKVVGKLQYLPSDTSLNIVSVDPKGIVKGQLLWAFNTKTRFLTFYKSGDVLGVKGTTLQNVTEAKAKKIRKPEVFFKEFMNCTPARRMKMFEAIKAVAKDANHRINKDTLLLKVQ